MNEHPGIIFRDGPTGRRAALASGPDVWEVVTTLVNSSARAEAAIPNAAESFGLPSSQMQIALDYYAKYTDEIEERVRRNLDEADAAEAAWLRGQAALE